MEQLPVIVSIRCLAYNHEPYIRECLEGFVMQKTNFRFEAIVHDDASTDGTADIIREYAKKYPDIIKPIFETENQYSKHNGSIERIMNEACTGKYIAMCEGDDYWTDPLKLQKQVDFLEEHEDYSMCVTNCATRLGNKFGVGNHYIWDTYTMEQVLLHNSRVEPRHTGDEIGPIAHTSTFVYRNFKVPTPAWMSKCFIGDEPITIWMSTYGKIKFLNEKTSVYRQNIGVSSRDFSFEKDFLNRIQMYKAVNEGLDYKYDSLICNRIISLYYKKLMRLYYHNKKCAKVIRCTFNYLYNLYK